jgi:hypothetical protein
MNEFVACRCGVRHAPPTEKVPPKRACQTCWRRGLPCITWRLRAVKWQCASCASGVVTEAPTVRQMALLEGLG